MNPGNACQQHAAKVLCGACIPGIEVVIPGNDSRKGVPLLGMGVYRICLLCGTALCGTAPRQWPE